MKQQFDWSEALDLKGAYTSARAEMFGDWLRDPWSWPELALLAAEPAHLIDRLNSGRTRFERMSVPKINFGTRPAVVQSPVDRLAYHAVVNSISLGVAGRVRDFVYGWRLSRTDAHAGAYLGNGQEWLAFIAHRRAASERHHSVLASDITNFFGSVPLDGMRDLIYRTAGKTFPVQAVDAILEVFNALPDRSGIPQRSTASAVLANAFLASVDDILSKYASAAHADVLRWMDDIWVFGGDHERLRCLQLDLQDELRNIGLEINLGKTFIREGEEALELVQAVDLERDPPTQDFAVSGMPYVASHHELDLEQQYARLIERPELTDRTAIRYVCARVRDLERHDLVPGLIAIVPRAPQGADHFARLLGRSGLWRELDGWYVEHALSPVGLERLPWPVAQLGTMFPSDAVAEPVAQLFGEILEKSKNVAVEVLAVCAHRLSSWKADDARVLLRRIGSESDSPLCRRIAAISLHNLGEEPARIIAILSEFEENAATRELLAQYGRKQVPANGDFDPAVAA